MQEILYSVIVFTTLLVLLVLMILWVRARLVPQGEVIIRVNGERDVKAPMRADVCSEYWPMRRFLCRLPVVAAEPVANAGSG